MGNINFQVFVSRWFLLHVVLFLGTETDFSSALVHNCMYYLSSNRLVANCSHKHLHDVPQDVNNSVAVLDLSSNDISSLGRGCLSKLKSLEQLLVSRNALDAIDEEAFGYMYSLTYIDLSYNQLALLPCNVFIKLKNLKKLVMTHNSFNLFSGDIFGGLTNLHFLDISSNKLDKRDSVDENTFVNLPNLKYLNISNCSLRYIGPETFTPLKNLLLLNIGYNQPDGFKLLRNMSYGLQNSTLQELYADYMECKYGMGQYVTIDSTMYFKYIPLTIIDISGNRIEFIEFGAMENFPKSIEIVYASENQFSRGLYAFELHKLSNLKVVYAGSKVKSKEHFGIEEVPGDIASMEKSMPVNKINVPTASSYCVKREVSNEQSLIGGKRCDYDITGFSGQPPRGLVPKELEKVYLRLSNFNFILKKIDFQKNNSLIDINLSGNVLYNWRGPLLNLHKLKILDLSENYCDNVSDVFFSDMLSLKYLLAGKNFLGFSLKVDVEGNIFQHLGNLTVLDLHFNRITHLPTKTFKGLVSLETLLLYENSLTEFTVDITHMRNISFINLSNNYINVLPEDTMTYLSNEAKRRNITIDLSHNQLGCTCAHIKFLKWLQHSYVHFVNISLYSCSDDDFNRHNLSEIDRVVAGLEKHCTSLGWLTTVCSIFISVFVVVIITVLIYKRRWKLRYVYYMTIGRYKLIHEDHGHVYRYDAFISYAEENEDFIKGHMLQELEEKRHISLCIHQRDFTPGNAVAANIVDAIQNSKKTIVIVSQAYIDSYWCLYEFNMARMEGLCTRGGRSVLFMVLLEHVAANVIPLEMMEVYENQSYIEYPHDEYGNVVFWERLENAIKQN